jgi:hypothetical protein
MTYTILNLEAELNSFDRETRRNALLELADNIHGSNEPNENVNMHFHSFFSYNYKSWSPSRIAWEAKKAGLYAAGLCDFDVLALMNFWRQVKSLDCGRRPILRPGLI